MNKFLLCNDILNWHKIKILPENHEVCVANYEDEELKTIKILETNANLAEFPDIIEPNGLSKERMRDLEFFRDYMENTHKNFQNLIDYTVINFS